MSDKQQETVLLLVEAAQKLIVSAQILLAGSPVQIDPTPCGHPESKMRSMNTFAGGVLVCDCGEIVERHG